jgi:hypothetical protein
MYRAFSRFSRNREPNQNAMMVLKSAIVSTSHTVETIVGMSAPTAIIVPIAIILIRMKVKKNTYVITGLIEALSALRN